MRKMSEYEDNAQKCLQMAATMKDHQQKKQLQGMADAWMILAGARKRRLAKWQADGAEVSAAKTGPKNDSGVGEAGALPNE